VDNWGADSALNRAPQARQLMLILIARPISRGALTDALVR